MESYQQCQLHLAEHAQMIHSLSVVCRDHPFYLTNNTATAKHQPKNKQNANY